ncbi:uncharacterized protein Dwil_GK25552 [Drosophila willistoni]|uniref:Large ribosomal subunit protein mL50 n=1 Tax=Drosophila willistoni TaxID=7260 RepID=B4N3Q8_DROWI|nr:39S ribosomal protein L50, mitochondrial [Drosophila willistoni]EDW79263.1 uncharacterized protein Dwil_GK25552 [Drosophila willistoni]
MFKQNQLHCVPRLVRCFASKPASKPQNVTLAAVGESIAAKGFLRPHKPYAPPPNAGDIVRSLASTLKLSGDQHKFGDLKNKFKFLSACQQEFNHSVPNSQIHEMETISDVIEFYQRSVDTTVPLDALKRADLPENLHIQYEYVRFNPETDTKFNGKTAFPKSSTLVTGLKYRKKYDGHEAKRSWP